MLLLAYLILNDVEVFVVQCMDSRNRFQDSIDKEWWCVLTQRGRDIP